MLRIVLGAEDLAALTFRVVQHVETVASVQILKQSVPGGPLDRWRRRAAARVPEQAGPLLALVPPRGYVPDFLTPETKGESPNEAFAAVSMTPRQQLQADFTRLDTRRASMPWVRQLAEGRREDLELVAGALRCYHRSCFADDWPELRQHLDAELARRASQMLAAGPGRVLATLHPAIRWRGGMLEVDVRFADNVELAGRGLRLVPSLFWRRPAFAADGFRTPTLVYPVPLSLVGDGSGQTALVDVMGRTRAAILHALAEPCGTSALAARVDVSLATASGHVATLRRARLAVSRRTGRSVEHALTPLGLELVSRQKP